MKKIREILFITIFASLAIWVISCGDGITDISNIKVVFPDTGKVSYINHVQPFLNQRCAYSGCHSDFNLAGGRSMSGYVRLFESANLGLIIPNNAFSSVLYQVVNGSNNHLYRYNLPIANQNQINGIQRWIDQGANDN